MFFGNVNKTGAHHFAILRMACGAIVLGKQSQCGVCGFCCRFCGGCSSGSWRNNSHSFAFRARGVSTVLLAHQAVLLRQVAVCVASVIGQHRCHLDFRHTVFHARHVAGVGLVRAFELFAWPQIVLRGHAVAVGHALLHFGNVFV